MLIEEVNTSPRFSGRVSKGPSQDSVGIAPFPSIELSTMNTSGSIQRKDYSIPVAPRAGIPPPHSSLSGLNPGLPSTTGGYGSFQTLASGTTSGNSSKVQSFYSQYGNDPIGSGLKMMYSNDFTSVSYDSKDSLGPNLMSKKRNMYNERVDTIGTLSESFDDHLDLNDANNSLIRGESARASALATLRSESPDDMDK